MERTANRYVLTNGRTLYVEGGVFGLSETDGLTVGYDGLLQRYQDGDYEALSIEDKIEIASYVLGQWMHYLHGLRREQATKGHVCGEQ